MIKKLNISTLATIALIYSLTVLLCLWYSQKVGLPIIFWIPSALSVGFSLIYGKKIIIPIAAGALIALLINLLALKILGISSLKIIITTTSDIIIGFTYTHFFKSRSPFLDYIDDLKRFSVVSATLVVIQTALIIVTFEAVGLYTQLSLSESFQIIFSAIAVSTVTIIPLILTTFGKLDETKKQFKNLTQIFLLCFAIFIGFVDITIIFNNTSLIPLQVIIIIFISALTIRCRFNVINLFVFLIALSLTIGTTLKVNFFATLHSPFDTMSAQYFSTFLALIVIAIHAILNERNMALQSIKESYKSVQNEVNRQTEVFRELNQKLISEVEQRGIIEKELTLSRKLLTESQEIANITSWEYDLKSKTIRWSESASRILGINSTQVSAFSMEKYIDRIHPDDKRAFMSAISKASENIRDINLEVRYQLKDQYRHFHIRGRSFDYNAEIERIVGVLSDITDWKEAQVALTEKEIRYRALFDTNIDPVILIDGNSKTIIDANKAFEELYEYSKNEVINTPYINLSAQEYETHQALDIALQKGFYRVPSRIHRKKNGEEFYVEGHFVKFTIGQNPLIFSVLRDNTSRKNFEFKLSERELKFRLFFESNLIGMAETTIYKTWITFNTKLCQILGYKPNELELLTWDKITHPNDLEFEIKQFNNILQRKTDNYTLEKRFIKKDKSLVYCNVAVKAIKDSTGNITHLVKLIEDITLRKKAENALLESQSRLRKAQQIAHLGVCRLSMVTGYLDVSEEAFAILDWEKDKAPFKLDNFVNTAHPSERNKLTSTIDRLKTTSTAEENLEARFINKQGNIFHLALNLGISQDTTNKVTDIIITFADITSSKLAEESLKETNAMKDQLFSVISHDLRGPIGSMEQLLNLYINSADSLDKESKDEIIRLVHNTSRESYNLLENLLEWGRSQRQSTIKPALIEIPSIVEETITLLSSMASSKDITIETVIGKDSKAFVDIMMLKTILRNLISNAIKFTPNGGKITLSSFTQNQECTIEIKDSGIGISADKIELIFDESKVFSTTGTNSEKGTGLGLKLVKRFVDKNGGNISVTSTEGKGTSFKITLPANETK